MNSMKPLYYYGALVFDDSEYGLFPTFALLLRLQVLHCMTLHKSQAEIKALSNLNTSITDD